MGWSGYARSGKFNAKKTVAEGLTFASQKEAKRYLELKWLEKAGQIRDLELQPVFPIEIHGTTVCRYVADFQYKHVEVDEGGCSGRLRLVVEDVKGVKTPVYRLKKKLVRALYGIDIQEV